MIKIRSKQFFSIDCNLHNAVLTESSARTFVFHVRALVSPLTRVRVHWAPYYLPMGVIARQLARRGEVVATSWETGPKEGEYAIPTGVRVFTMKGVKVADVPRLITVALGDEVGGDTAELLVTIPGRKPLCRRVGHASRLQDAVLPSPRRVRPQLGAVHRRAGDVRAGGEAAATGGAGERRGPTGRGGG